MTGSGSGWWSGWWPSRGSGSGSGSGVNLSGEPDCAHWSGYTYSGSGSGSGSGTGSGSGSGSGSGTGSGSGSGCIDLHPVKKCGCNCGGDFDEHIRYGFGKKKEWSKET